MSQKILVTYATRTGSTTGVAKAIANTLRENSIEVDVIPMQEVRDVTSYQAVVAGSAIQNRGWLPEAVQFVQTHRNELKKKTFAMFAVCMTLAMKNGENYLSQISDWLAPVRRIVSPVSEGIFAGVLNIGKIPSFGDRLKFRLSVLFGVWSEGDHRDWNAIRFWAESLPEKLL